MKTLIFGGAGFIGTNLVAEIFKSDPKAEVVVFDNLSMGNRLAELGSKAGFVKGDMCNFNEVNDVIAGFNPERIFHLAANSDIAQSALNPAVDLDNTFMTTFQLAKALKGRSIKELVFASSSAVYGEVDGAISESTTKLPTSPYGWMKLASEYLLDDLAKSGAVERYLCVRFPNVTGSWQTHGVVFDLVRKLKANPGVLAVLGDGTQLKPYALASELASNFLQVLNAPWNGQLELNLSPDTQTSVREIVDVILDISQVSPQVSFAASRSGWKGDVPEYRYDTSKAKEFLGPNHFSSSTHAITESVKWAWANL